jgi:hypothetical protein
MYVRPVLVVSQNALANQTPSHQVFLNIVLDEAVEEKANGDKVQIGMVVSPSSEYCNGWHGTADRAFT